MIQRHEILPAHRAYRSEFDHRAINVTGHLLLGIVWLEHRIASLPEQLEALVELVARSGAARQRLVPVVTGATGHRS